MSEAHVVDTNVLCVAEDKSDDWPTECGLECIRFLAELRKGGRLVLDDAQRILKEYGKALDAVGNGQPGVGRLFLHWAYRNWANEERCEIVPLTPLPLDPGDFEEFPQDPALADFHTDDRKFVAVALASERNPDVVEATDSDWWDAREALLNNGVRVRFLCPEVFEAS